MPNHMFTGIDGTRYPCLHAEGRDPLLANWNAGGRGTHDGWTDKLFWQAIAAEVREGETYRRNLSRKQRARKP